MLHTLGGLRPLGEVRQPKLLLLLTYLALEGSTSRSSLARLFWPQSPRPLSNLSVALSALRGCLPGVLEADADRVGAKIATDAQEFLSALADGDEALAAKLYRGPFLLGVESGELGAELEEWVLGRRESTAERYRSALLRWAEAAVAGRPSQAADPTGMTRAAARLADAAYRVPGAAPADAVTLQRVHALLASARHPSSTDVLKEVEELGVVLASEGAASPEPLANEPVGEAEQAAHLPPPPRSRGLIGREPERLELQRLLIGSDARLVTLHGPGGIGKTSLAAQVIGDLEAADEPPFPDGVAFVELEGIHDAEALPYAVARALGRSSLLGHRGLEALRSVLPTGRTLLVLDNLEQVEGAAQALERLLAIAPGLTVLVTSRELLGIKEEVAFLLDGLQVPASAEVEGAGAFDAIRLFVQVARRADAGFELAPEQLPDVVRLCRSVGGSPLGIELAAAWVRAVPLRELAKEVESNVDLLRRSHTTGRQRHASARSSFDWSWARLDAQHRRALAALSVFAGGFTLSEAREVGRLTLPQLARLVDAALLRVGAEGRYAQHPLVVRFAREKLAVNRPREKAVLDRHAEHFLTGLEARSDDLRLLRPGVLEDIDADFENIAGAWQHAVRTCRAELISGAAFPLMRYADLRARLQEGKTLLSAAAAFAWPSNEPCDRARGWALASLAWVLSRLGDHRAAIEAGVEARSVLAPCDDHGGIRVADHALASSHYRAGDYATAQELYEKLLDGASEDPTYRAELLGRLGLVAQAVGDYDRARERYREALAANRELRNVSGVVTQLLNMGALDMNSDAPQTAVERFEEALRLANEHGYQQVVPVLLHNLANLACKARRFVEAREKAHQALRMVVSSGERGLESGMLATLGWIEMEAGDLVAAEAHARQAVSVARYVGDEPAQQTAVVRLGQVLLAKGRTSEAAELLESASAHSATLTWARRLAQKLRQQVAL